MVISTWADLVAGLDSALAFAKALNLDTPSTRFSSYRERINELSLAARLHRAGFAVDLSGADAELRFTLPFRFHVRSRQKHPTSSIQAKRSSVPR